MKKDILQDSVLGLLATTEELLIGFCQHPQSEDLHRLRVNIKKLRALFSFVGHVHKKQHVAQWLKALFKEAGAIRELQINRRMLAAFPQPPLRLMKQLLTREKALTEELIQHKSIHLHSISQVKAAMDVPEKWPSHKAISNYFDKERKKAKQEWEQKDRESLHRYRMSLKKIMYVYDVLPDAEQVKLDIDKSAIHLIQEDLGDWHDTYAAIHFLKQQPLPKKSAEALEQLIQTEELQFLNFYRN